MDGQSENLREPQSGPVVGRRNLGALNIEFRAEGDWQAA
jgi:hypothetical protein